MQALGLKEVSEAALTPIFCWKSVALKPTCKQHPLCVIDYERRRRGLLGNFVVVMVDQLESAGIASIC